MCAVRRGQIAGSRFCPARMATAQWSLCSTATGTWVPSGQADGRSGTDCGRHCHAPPVGLMPMGGTGDRRAAHAPQATQGQHTRIPWVRTSGTRERDFDSESARWPPASSKCCAASGYPTLGRCCQPAATEPRTHADQTECSVDREAPPMVCNGGSRLRPNESLVRHNTLAPTELDANRTNPLNSISLMSLSGFRMAVTVGFEPKEATSISTSLNGGSSRLATAENLLPFPLGPYRP